MSAIRFATPSAGYAYGQSALDFTADGGRTWRAVAVGAMGRLLALGIGGGQAFLAVRADTAADITVLRAVGSDVFAALPGVVLTHSATARLAFDGRFGYLSGGLPAAGIVRSTSSYLFQHRDVEPVVLAAGGGTAGFFVSYGHNPIGNATSCPVAARALVYPPDDTQGITAPASIQPCGNLLISPVVASIGL